MNMPYSNAVVLTAALHRSMRENARLREENARLQKLLNVERREENARLQKLLNAEQRKPYHNLVQLASVLGRSPIAYPR
jgi:cell shape-determining protein MreC